MDAARRDKWIGFLCLGVTAFGWALNWPLMKLLLQQWPPLFSRGLAGVASALILFSIAKARGQALEVPREAVPRLLFASFTNVFAWMGFGTVAMKFVPVGEGALIVYTMPIWATLLAWPLAGIRPKLVDIAALVLGIGGIAVLLGGNGLSFDGGRIVGIVLLFSAAILFAIGNILNRAPLADAAAGRGRLAGRARLPRDADPRRRVRAARTMARSRRRAWPAQST